MSYKAFLFYCDSSFKKDKIEELQSDYNTNLLFNIFQAEHSKATGKNNKDIKSWYEIKKMVTDGTQVSEKSDEEIEKEAIEKYNKYFT